MSTFRAALWLIHDVTLPSLRQFRLRAVLTLSGIVIGTQMVVAIGLINRSVLASFEHTTQTIAGRAELQLTNGSGGVPEEIVATLAAAPEVATAAGLLAGNVVTSWGDLAVFGVDIFDDQRIRETQFPREHVHIPDGLKFANAPDSIAVSSQFLASAGLGLDSDMTVNTPTGERKLVVRGTLDPVGPAALFGGAVALVDFPTAQSLFGRAGQFDQIDLMLKPGVDVAAAQLNLAPLVAGRGTLETPERRGIALGSMLGAVQAGLTVLSLIAVIVGTFIIYHTIQTAIANRRRELALTRAVGYRQRVIWTALAIEVFVFGALGSALGVVLGIGAARASLRIVTTGIGAIWARVDDGGLVIAPPDILLALVFGLGSTLAGAAIPALAAARLQVTDHLRSSADLGTRGRTRSRATIVVGLGTTLLGFMLFYSRLRPPGYPGKIGLIMAAILLVALGYTLLAPLLTAVALRPLVTIGRRLPGVAAALATENIARDPARSRGTIAALMVAFAMVLIVNTFIHSLRTSILAWVDQTWTSDLLVSPTLQFGLPAGPTIDGALEARFRQIPGVTEVNLSRMINVRVGDTLAVLRTESAGGSRRQHYLLVEGDPATFASEFAAGRGVLVSDSFAYRHRVHAGDEIHLDTPSGRRTFPVIAVVLDFTLDIGTILMERELYRGLWKDELVNSFGIWLAPGADRDAIRAAVAQVARPDFTIAVFTGAEFKRNVTAALDNALLITYAIQVVAIGIAIIGVINFFLAEVVDRRREIGLLRSIGLDGGQILRVLAAEAIIIGTLGGIAAVLFAAPVAHALVTQSIRLVSGMRLAFTFPLLPASATVVVAAVTSLVAALYPANRAANTSIVDLVVVE